MWFFGLVYVVEGIGQTGGLIAQPLNYYLKQTFGWTPVQVSAYLTILNLPWIIKPVYGSFRIFCRSSATAARPTSFLPTLRQPLPIAGLPKLLSPVS